MPFDGNDEKPEDTAGAASATEAQAKPEASRPEPAEPLISIDDFFKIKLRVAEIRQADRIEKADKLLKLTLSLGDEERQIVAGVATRYQPEDLVGKKIIVVANLKPARLRGVESQGMLLAAEDADGNAIIATFDEPVTAGARVR